VLALVADCDLAVHRGDTSNADVVTDLERRISQVIAVAGNTDVPAKSRHQHPVLPSSPLPQRSDYRAGY
jgi:predicted phosphodiesterase